MLIDTHHHFWRYTAEEFGWIDADHAEIRRDFLPEQLAAQLAADGVDGVISVQARQSEEETRWLLELAGRHAFIRGVVGWVGLASPNARDALGRLTTRKLVGVRHVVQGEPDGFLDRDDFNRGVALLPGLGLRYDLLVFARQLPETTRFVDRHPGVTFVLDHLAKPDVRGRELEPWRADLRELARRPNVYGKIAGGVVEADPKHWTPAALAPYFDAALEAFGPRRLMFGSNWPLTEPAGGYGRWLTAVRDWAAKLSPGEQERLFAGSAIEAYGLNDSGH